MIRRRDPSTRSFSSTLSRCLIGLFLLGSLSLGAARTAAAQAPPEEDHRPSRMRFVRWTYQDAGALAWDAGRYAPFIAVAGAPALGTASLIDAPVQQAVQQSHAGLWGSYLDGVNNLGETARTLPATAGLFALSLTTKNTRLQDAAFTSFQSVLYARLITNALKGVVGRARPEAGRGPRRLEPFSGSYSFPSGHTTTVFAAITPWVLYYPNVATYGLLVLGTGTAVARMALDKHWPTDVLAGAAVGFFVGRYLTKRHLATASSDSDARYDVAFGNVEGAPGLGLHLGLDLAQRDRRAPTETMQLNLSPALTANSLGLALQVRFQ